MDPRHFPIGDGFHPGFLFLVERNTHDLEALVVILLVSRDNVGHFGLAGTAPGGPEVDQDPLALSHILAQLVQFPVGTGLLQVHELLADKGGLGSFRLIFLGRGLIDLAFEGYGIGMLRERSTRSHQFIELLLSGKSGNIAQEHDRDQVIHILFNHRDISIAIRFDPGLIIRDELRLASFLLILGKGQVRLDETVELRIRSAVPLVTF